MQSRWWWALQPACLPGMLQFLLRQTVNHIRRFTRGTAERLRISRKQYSCEPHRHSQARTKQDTICNAIWEGYFLVLNDFLKKCKSYVRHCLTYCLVGFFLFQSLMPILLFIFLTSQSIFYKKQKTFAHHWRKLTYRLEFHKQDVSLYLVAAT